MINIKDYIRKKFQYLFRHLFEKWKYLLLQEKCRLCKRMIHPLIEKMDFEYYGPPAQYFIAHKEIISDTICQFCLADLTHCQAVVRTHQIKQDMDDINEAGELLVASSAVFREPVQSLIYKLKYSEDVLLAKDLACLIYRAWQLLRNEITNIDQLDSLCLVPVPLHKKRLHERGFNQAEILAQHLACILSIKLESKLLIRIRNTKSQQKLAKAERAKNVSEAFQAIKPDIFIGKKVILIDDVSTSGATLLACAKAIMVAGAESVYALTIAYVP